MSRTRQTIIIGFTGAVAFGFVQITAITTEGSGWATKVNEGPGRLAGAPVGNGAIFCGLPKPKVVGGVTSMDETPKEIVRIRPGIRRGQSAEIHIHRSVLKGILKDHEIAGLSEHGKVQPQLRFSADEINAQNDKIVANFETSSRRKSKIRGSNARNGASSFFGFKTLLGRRANQRKDGQEGNVDVYFRIIIDATHQTRSTREVSLTRAAYILSQVPVSTEAQPVREMYYRFWPTRSPFRMLACILKKGQAI